MIGVNKNLAFAISLMFFLAFAKAQNGEFQAFYTSSAPIIDGDSSDEIWSKIETWYSYKQVWLNNVGSEPTEEDFAWKYKLAWDEDRFYILAIVTDDSISDKYSNPTDRYYEDDCLEVFFDEDKSGGNHQNSFQAFAYHISLKYDIVDSDNFGRAQLLNDHANVKMDTVDGKYVWEVAFKVYGKNFTIANPGEPVKLFAGKKMGWGLSYCDNDGRASRDHFFGSQNVNGTNKNVAYINADVFGTVELINPSVPTFSHVLVDDGLSNPTAMRIAPNGDIYVCEQSGKLRVLQDGELKTQYLVDIPVNKDGSSYTERGLLGLAFDPDFETNNYIYLFYTSGDQFVHSRVSRFTLDGLNNVSSTEIIITELDSLSDAFNHNGGALHFGTDGKLYIATGENATPANAQNLSNTHGKLLRINSDGSIPFDNPFLDFPDVDPRIWAYGLRNPFTFDISSHGDIILNDVGFEKWEELDDATVGGKNFGWPIEEGRLDSAKFEKPNYSYSHDISNVATDSTGCAITGGVYFEPITTNYPQEYIGKYFFMDYCNKWINLVDPHTGLGRKTFATNTQKYPIAIEYHPDGNLYYLTRGNGAIYKITYSGEPKPIITRQPKYLEATINSPFEIEVFVGGEEPMTYVWEKNGEEVLSGNSNSFVIPETQYSDSGTYVLKIKNAFGDAETSPIVVKVVEFNSKPKVSLQPLPSNTFYGGKSMYLVGEANDLEDSTETLKLFWRVDLHHGSHVHDGIPQIGNDTFKISFPSSGGHTETIVFYRVNFIALDSKGLSSDTFVDIFPELIEILVESEPLGLQFSLDGSPFKTPYTFESIKGMNRSLGMINNQILDEVQYTFDFWDTSSDSVFIIQPMEDTSYKVNYKVVPISGIKSNKDLELKIFPNPFSIEGLHVENEGIYNYQVLDVSGKIIEIGTMENSKIVGQSLKSGVYYLIIESNTKNEIFKVVKY